ncbi:MAG: TetR family transcriptional regulator [Myxococcota bacterium]
MEGDYQRARTVEQKEQRRQHILAVAREMLAEVEDPGELSLSALARRSGMAKSNLYRYFESREAVLLELLTAEWLSWHEDVLLRIRSIRSKRRIDGLVRVLAACTASRPLLCQLMHILPSVLERNLQFDTVRDFKLGGASLSRDLAHAFAEQIPDFEVAQHAELLRHLFIAVVGLWPLAHPVASACLAMEDPRLESMRFTFESDLKRMLALIAKGLG